MFDYFKEWKQIKSVIRHWEARSKYEEAASKYKEDFQNLVYNVDYKFLFVMRWGFVGKKMCKQMYIAKKEVVLCSHKPMKDQAISLMLLINTKLIN